jgi:hypothetical protein
VSKVHDWNANFAHLAARQYVVWVVTRLGGQVESNRKSGLTFSEVGSVQSI